MADRLQTFLESFGPEHVKRAVSTTSKYYAIYGQIFRISDHLSQNKEVDMHIIIPTNSSETYILFLKGGIQFIAFSFEELKSFINNFVLYWRVSHPAMLNGKPAEPEKELEDVDPNANEVPLLTDPDVPSNTSYSESKKEEVKEENKEEVKVEKETGEGCLWHTQVSLDSPERVSTNELYGILAEKHIIPVFPTWRELSSSTKKQCRDIFRLNITFDEAVQVLKDIISKTRAPKNIENMVTRYLNEHDC